MSVFHTKNQNRHPALTPAFQHMNSIFWAVKAEQYQQLMVNTLFFQILILLLF